MSLDFKATLDDGPFQTGLRKMEAGAQKTESKIAKLGASMGSMLSFGTVAMLGKGLLDFAGDLNDSAEGLGMNVEQLQRLQGVFSKSGVNAEKFDKGMGKLTQSLQDARDNTGNAREAFDKLGITWADIDGASPDAVLMKIADALKNSKDPIAAYAAATDLLGKGQTKMIGALKQGSDAIKEQGEGINVMSRNAVEDLDKLGDAFSRVKGFAASFFVAAGESLGGGLSDLMDGKMPWDLSTSYKGPDMQSPESQAKAAAKEDPRAAAEAKKKQEEEDKIAAKVKENLDEVAQIKLKDAQSRMGLEEKIKSLQEERAAIEAEMAKADALKASELQKVLALKDIEIRKEKALKMEKLEAQMELDKIYEEQRKAKEANDKRNGNAFKSKIQGASIGGSAFGEGGIFSTGFEGKVGGLSSLSRGAYGQTPILDRKEREQMENDRVARGEGRTASAGAYGAVRNGDKKRRQEFEKKEAQKKLTLEGTNNLLDRMLKLQEIVWGKG